MARRRKITDPKAPRRRVTATITALDCNMLRRTFELGKVTPARREDAFWFVDEVLAGGGKKSVVECAETRRAAVDLLYLDVTLAACDLRERPEIVVAQEKPF